MRVIEGKQTRNIDAAELAGWARARDTVAIDLGAGDGRFVRDLAARSPASGVIGIDLCAERLRAASRATGNNALFVIADALTLPSELGQIATSLTINFPWGSLLRGLLAGDAGLLGGLEAVSRSGAAIDIVVNAGALAEAGWPLAAGSDRIAAVLRDAGIAVCAMQHLGPRELRRCPTTWAKRLAYGRDPNAVHVTGVMGDRAVGDGMLHLPLKDAKRTKATGGRRARSLSLSPITYAVLQ